MFCLHDKLKNACLECAKRETRLTRLEVANMKSQLERMALKLDVAIGGMDSYRQDVEVIVDGIRKARSHNSANVNGYARMVHGPKYANALGRWPSICPHCMGHGGIEFTHEEYEGDEGRQPDNDRQYHSHEEGISWWCTECNGTGFAYYRSVMDMSEHKWQDHTFL
jgi:hypothetical protein